MSQEANAERAFWSWMARLKTRFIDERKSIARLVDEEIRRLPAAEALLVRGAYIDLFHRADQLLLWEACSLLVHAPVGDDSFEYFRNWLMWQGREVFERALKEPDSIADLVRGGRDETENPFVEELSSLAEMQQDDQRASRCRAPISRGSFLSKWSWQDASTSQMSNDLPQLWELLGQDFSTAGSQSSGEKAASRESCTVPGIGRISIGDSITHRFGFGMGVVVAFPIPEHATATIEFADGRRTMRISAKHFSRFGENKNDDK